MIFPPAASAAGFFFIPFADKLRRPVACSDILSATSTRRARLAAMWNLCLSSLDSGRTRIVTIVRDELPLSYRQVVQGWRRDPDFRAFFIQLLADMPFAAYFWETPPIHSASLARRFECVLVDSPELALVPADPAAFADRFAAAGSGEAVVTFANLGGDALLVAPCPQAAPTTYPHLAAFSRSAPLSQQQALWRRVGEAVTERLDHRPVWISTSGLGVYWLHVRLDSRPKYYTHAPYRVSA